MSMDASMHSARLGSLATLTTDRNSVFSGWASSQATKRGSGTARSGSK